MDDYFHQSNLIEGYDDPEFDAQSRVAWDYLCEVTDIDLLDHHCIKKVQKIITLKQDDLQPDWRGCYRKIDVWVGGRKGLMPNRIEEAMTTWIDRLVDTDPIKAHILFEKIHPFVDGNGRTGRMLLWWQQRRLGQEPTMFLNSEKHRNYYPLFK